MAPKVRLMNSSCRVGPFVDESLRPLPPTSLKVFLTNHCSFVAQVHSSFDVKNPYGDVVQPKAGPGDPGFVVGGGLTSTGALGFGSGDDVVKSIGKKERELAAGFTASRTDKYAGFDSEIGFNAAGRPLEKDGGEFNTVGLQGAHDYSKTEAGRFILEEKRKFEAAKAAMSETKVRDADGTIDRVDDSVAEKLMPILFAIKERCRTEHINLESVFEVRNEYGIQNSIRHKQTRNSWSFACSCLC